MNVTLATDTITPSIKRMQAALRALPAAAHAEFVQQTPVRSGNARRHTRLRGRTIEAQYPYAQRLDDGWSKQAPDGMTTPVQRFINNEIKKIMRL